VHATATAIAAVAGFPGFEVDLVLLDVGLPAIDGVECARRLRGLKYDGPIIFLTADDSEETVRAAIAQRAYAYLVKPISGAQLLPLITTAMAASQATRLQQDKLVTALDDSRAISAAVGILAERNGWSIEVAFEALRAMARSRQKKITEVAAEILDRSPTRAKGPQLPTAPPKSP
jgi:response regulator NasT